MSWRPQANCLGADPTLFHPQRGESAEAAKAVCASCMVRIQCLDENIHEIFGVWGGLTEQERRKVRRARRREQVA